MMAAEVLTKRKKSGYSLDFDKYNKPEQPLADYGPRIVENIERFDSTYYKTAEVSLQTTLCYYLGVLLVRVFHQSIRFSRDREP
jgi:hypothetical protein